MKIAIVNQPIDGVLPPDQTSLGIWSFETAPLLAREPDTDVVVYSRRLKHRSGGARTVVDGVSHRFIRTGPMRPWDTIGRIADRIIRNKEYPAYARPWFHGLFALQVGLDIRRKRCGFVHIHNWVGLVPIIRLLNPEAVIGLHMNCDWLSQLSHKQMRKRIRRVDLVLGCSDHVVDAVRSAFPDAAAKCVVLPNGVDPARFISLERHADQPPTVLFVGRVSPEKGVHDLLEALEIVIRDEPRLRVEIVGPVGAMPADRIVGVSDDPEVAALQQWYGRSYGDQLHELMSPALTEAVSFVGALTHDEVVAHTQRCDVLVNPSYSESFGMSLVEAMACCRPVVATRVGGMQMVVVDGTTGLLVPRGDADALAGAIIRLLEDSELRQQMGRAGRARVEERFSWTVISEEARRLYSSVERA